MKGDALLKAVVNGYTSEIDTIVVFFILANKVAQLRPSRFAAPWGPSNDAFGFLERFQDLHAFRLLKRSQRLGTGFERQLADFISFA
jgi:hypothetical protein